MASRHRPAGLALVSADALTGNNNQLAGTPTTAGAFTMKLTDNHPGTSSVLPQVVLRFSIP